VADERKWIIGLFPATIDRPTTTLPSCTRGEPSQQAATTKGDWSNGGLPPIKYKVLNTGCEMSSSSSSNSWTPPDRRALRTQPSQLQYYPPLAHGSADPAPEQRRHPSIESLTPQQQQLFQAYLHGVRSGHIPMPSVAVPSQVSKTQQQGNHSRTISDAKKGVTYAGQDELKKLPIPTLEETCERYLQSVRPFLVRRTIPQINF